MIKKLVAGIAAASLAALSGCGGNVIVDGAATAGTGGTSGTTSTTGSTEVSCFNLPTHASLKQCGGGSSPQFACSFIYNCNDPAGSWEADCNGSACTCLHSGMVLCDCAFSSGDVCGTGVDCCFK